MFDTRKFGGYLSRLRKNADMTQSDLADKLNLTRQAVSKYEMGDCFPDVSVLVLITEIFNVTLDELIGSGDPTRGESLILGNIAVGNNDIIADNIEDVINLAPLLKPSVLDKLSSGLIKKGIDITNIINLAEYLNNDSVIDMLENTTFDNVNEELLEKLMPMLDVRSKIHVFGKILNGEMDWHLLKSLIIHSENSYGSQIEAAVIEGALPWDALELLHEAYVEITERRKKEEY